MAKPSLEHNHGSTLALCRQNFQYCLFYYLFDYREQIHHIRSLSATSYHHFQRCTKARSAINLIHELERFDDSDNLHSTTESRISQLQIPSLAKQRNGFFSCECPKDRQPFKTPTLRR
ncbi:hypothetical protein JHK82_013272 [Glycine max]|uniref:Uncharacterized protein n=2 Tax=Glycine subgen. Soja TaxID=1462606 RepID=K7KQX9_SOYBN|nr:hypothetical protein JHK85_013639 [Glycine max]RZC12960.1 hypothetical protein D0Y65_012617 [Glycine soja]KAG5058303.1 hypothetical protein JHK86_013299 [Glycine max]KAG5155303.1 hypothetical protein JHK82_013272 [Glycine max]KAH1134969.1 hypothetical protein GYH30_013009 [Glycine max]